MRRRKRSIELLRDMVGVEDVIVDRPRRRIKRDFIHEQQPFIGPENGERIRRQTTFFERREVPKLPFPDPLYQDQWYLVRILLIE